MNWISHRTKQNQRIRSRRKHANNFSAFIAISSRIVIRIETIMSLVKPGNLSKRTALMV